MTRYKLTIEYDGRGLVGWQKQDNGPSVQEALEDAVTAFCGETPRLFAAGRTDAGVHATGQVAHVDIDKTTTAETVMKALNAHLRPAPIAVLEAEAVSEAFHARFSAIGRSYRYEIINRTAPLTFDRGLALHVPQELDAEAMDDAAQALVGHHDFTSFRAKECQADSPLKTLDLLQVDRDNEYVTLIAEACSFLHHQIRNITGTLLLVGRGKWTRNDVEAALAARDRAAAGPTAPPDGLYLTGISYAKNRDNTA